MSYLEKRRNHILNDRPIAEKKSKRLNPISEKRKSENEKYKILRDEFLAKKENKFCACGCGRKATEIHHSKGRGKLLCDVRFFKAVSSGCHRRIENMPKDAKEKKLSISRVTDNVFDIKQ